MMIVFLLLIRKQRAQKVSASFPKYINCKSITFYNILKTYWLYQRRTVNYLFRIFWTRSCSNIHIKGQFNFLSELSTNSFLIVLCRLPKDSVKPYNGKVLAIYILKCFEPFNWVTFQQALSQSDFAKKSGAI